MFRQAKDQLEGLRELVGDRAPCANVVRTGSPHREIINAAVELHADLIIMSTHGRTGLAHALLGSTVEKVARHGACPILIVRERQHDFVAASDSAIDKPAQAKPPSIS